MWESIWSAWIETWASSESAKEEVKEEDVVAVQEDQKKAKQAASQKKRQQTKDRNIAELLSIVVRNIENDKIVLHFFHFYKKSNPYHIFDLMYPFLSDFVADDFRTKLTSIDWSETTWFQSYTSYIKKVLSTNKSLKKINENDILDFLFELFCYYNIWWVNKDNEDFDENKLKDQIKKEIF